MADGLDYPGGIQGTRGAGGGGAATNAGIDFQQRVAAFILVACLGSVDLGPSFGFSQSMVPNLVRFESSSPVDDVVFETTMGITHYCQAKRTINLSEAEGSDFASVIDQFVRQFVLMPAGAAAYWLVVGNGASQRIRSVLRSLLDALRLNPQAEIENPMAKEDNEVFNLLKGHFDRCFRRATGRGPYAGEFVAFAEKTHIIEINAEHAQPHEAAALAYLTHVSAIPPELLWRTLVVQALTFSEQRQSVTSEGLAAHNARFLTDGKSAAAQDEAINEAIRYDIQHQGILPTGKEVLLLPGWPEANQFSIVELFRFDEACRKKQSYGVSGVQLRSIEHPLNVSWSEPLG